jgi:hypothetical protein
MIVSSDSNSLRLVDLVLGDNLSLLLVCLDLAFKDVPFLHFSASIVIIKKINHHYYFLLYWFVLW